MALREVNDRIVQARCKSVDLAIIVRGLYQNGIMITSTSSLVREALQWLAYNLVESGEVERMSQEDALDILARLGMDKLPSKYKRIKQDGYVGDRLRARMVQPSMSVNDVTDEMLQQEILANMDKLKTQPDDSK